MKQRWLKFYDVRRKAFVRRARRTRRYIRTSRFAQQYAAIALVILGITTLYWSNLGVNLHNQNADQLIDPALFNDSPTLHTSIFPAAHSELIKWPLFWLIAVFNSTGLTLRIATILLSMATVGGLAFTLHRFVKRRLYYGTLILALASCLLLIPSQPYPGALLPLNFAMIATRNFEYIVYLIGLWLMVRAGGIKSRDFWIAGAILGILFASDRLYLSISLLAGLMITVIYWFRHRNTFYLLGLKLLGVSVVGTLIQAGLIKLVNLSGVAHIIGTASPYNFVHNLHNLALAIFYGGLGLLTNFGANPAYDATTVRQVPSNVVHHFMSFGGLAFSLNIVIFILLLWAAYDLIKGSMTKKFRQVGTALSLGLVLIACSLSALILFISSDHYYPVDARYLTISLFALFITAAWRLRQVKLPADRLIAIGTILTLGIVLALVFTMRTHRQANQILSESYRRNQSVADALSHHQVEALVGDFWRVIPLIHNNKLETKPMPLVNCSDQRSSLTSTNWQLDLKHHSFAYLLSLDRSLTNFPNCNLEQVAQIYGRPSSSVLIAGELSQPKELLLFYDRGSNMPESEAARVSAQASLLPIDLAKLPATRCDHNSVVNVVAHEDDDLLFLSPNLLQHLQAGDCVRTIFLTAGDAGIGRYYWLEREQGSEAAYAEMLHAENNWLQRTIKLGDHQYASIARLVGHSSVSLIFMYLPDGGLNGDGFRDNSSESLAKLADGQISFIQTVDRQSSYSHQELVAALQNFITTFGANQIITQSTLRGTVFPDHSDHNTVGRLSTEARNQLNPGLPILYFKGYPSHEEPSNVSGDFLQQKTHAFSSYALKDDGICWDEPGCHQTMIYGLYLQRQYTSPN